MPPVRPSGVAREGAPVGGVASADSMGVMSDNDPEVLAEPSTLVDDWIDEVAAAELLGVTVAQVRTMVRRHELATCRPGPGLPPQIPALFVQDGLVVKGLPGLLTVLHDGGYDDAASIAWIYTDLDLPGRPIDALRENRGSEAKRRAQALAF